PCAFMSLAALSIVLHEIGHLVMGGWLGFSPFRITLGHGPVVGKWNWGRRKVVLRAYVFSGHVLMSRLGSPGTLMRTFGVFAAGPIVTSVLVALGGMLSLCPPAWIAHAPQHWRLQLIGGVRCIYNACVLIEGLLPMERNCGGL